MSAGRTDVDTRPAIAANPISADALLTARVFTVFWAIAHLAHMLRKGDPEAPLMWLVVAAAFLVIERPGSRGRLALLALAELAYAAELVPRIDNHLLIMCFVNLGLLVSIVRSLPARAAGPDATPPLGALPYARVVLVLAYGAAAIAKLNHGFFDTANSCAVNLFEGSLGFIGGGSTDVVDALAPVLPFVVATLELAIPVLLLVRRTRLVGVAVTITFHVVMTLSPTTIAGVGFTYVLLALVFLFLPERAAAHVVTRTRPLTDRIARPPWRRWLVVIVGAVLVVLLITFRRESFLTIEGNGNWLVLAVAMVVVAALLLDATWRSWRERWPRRLAFDPRHVAYYVLVALVLLDAASPYVGGKTITSFTMYSNLQTERDSSNHFFLPLVSLANGQDDLVEIVDSSHRGLRNIGASRALITWHELRRTLTKFPDASIQYRRDGVLFAHEHARDDPELVDLDPVSARLLAYRLVDREGEPARCRW